MPRIYGLHAVGVIRRFISFLSKFVTLSGEWLIFPSSKSEVQYAVRRASSGKRAVFSFAINRDDLDSRGNLGRVWMYAELSSLGLGCTIFRSCPRVWKVKDEPEQTR